MRLLCLNANTTPYVTDTVADAMRAALGPAADVVPCTPAFGPAIIKTRVDNAVAAHGVLDAAARHRDVDGVMLAVSFDTALDALREALSVPVVGMTEASVAMARMLGGRIGYVSMGRAVAPLYAETLTHCALERDLAGWESVEAPAAYRPGDKTAVDRLLAAAAGRLAEAGADVVVLVGAVLAGAAARVQAASAVPVIDGGAAGALTLRAMVDLAAPKPRVGRFALRPGGGLAGVSAALGALQPPDALQPPGALPPPDAP
ncbi:MAG: aspartate/glutamate racemase family protein [Pseudomonadota bacterium]